ncbi:hypothetical protein ISF_05019 [Cordyceps fumosorosea ARSEF 2679]|uniref:Uncharacterized protein n=1 Tax=Cordyceps fumosorosea (strain ARSEF 2679) TaxID=1081104 RepID=A0A167VZ87_CORFA|nr:hypothetical protein ISF_05019 [Cordyceps fumosorosea ARSEF 2679]OAA63143.1 hypothetical protein ISF_05019 [Cordyceps fumosorosea ARSEF 2679]
MKISTAVAVIVYANCIAAFVTIPKDLDDGIYQVEQPASPDDQPLIKRIDNLPPPPSAAAAAATGPSARLRRSPKKPGPKTPFRIGMFDTTPLPKSKEFCRNETHTMSRADLHAATNELFYTPLYWLPPKAVRFALHGSAVAYICNIGGGWEPASLVEYMEATRMLDDRCRVPGTEQATKETCEQLEQVRAAKLSVTSLEKFYGREVPGVAICRWETEKGGLENRLLEVQKNGCRNFVYLGIGRKLSGGKDLDESTCERNVSGEWMWETLKSLFPWYTKDRTAHV